MVEKIKELIAELKVEQKENNAIWGEDMEDFNPMDASGGNFDDCYYMGLEHGRTDGKLDILYMILIELERENQNG